MAKTEKIEKVKEDAPLDVAAIDKKLNGIAAVLRKVKQVLEIHTGVDVDEDGKIGAAKRLFLGVMAACGLIALACWAGTTELVNWPAPEGDNGWVGIYADEGDDNADKWYLWALSAGGFCVSNANTGAAISISSAGAVSFPDGVAAPTISGDITLANGETIDNATDAEVRITANDDAALLMEVALESDNAVGSIADNDLMSITATWYDSATNKQEWASIDFKCTDRTNTTEDSQILLNYLSGGSAKAVTIGSSQAGTIAMTVTDDLNIDGVGTLNCDTIEEDGTGGVAIEGMTLNDGAFTDADGTITISNITVNGEVTLDGKYAAVGPDATTGIMIAYGSTTNSGTVTFPNVFGATPKITLGVQGAATNATGGTAAARVTSKNATNCVIYCDGFVAGAAATVDVIAAGTRP